MSLTRHQKSTLLACCEAGKFYCVPALDDVQANPKDMLGSGFTAYKHAVPALCRKGLIRPEVPGVHMFVPTEHGREFVLELVRREDPVLVESADPTKRDPYRAGLVSAWLDKVMLPPGPGRSLAAILRDATNGDQI